MPELWFVCCVQTILKLLMTGRDHPRGGIMIPIPQYPLYTATIAEYNAYGVRMRVCTRVRDNCRVIIYRIKR